MKLIFTFCLTITCFYLNASNLFQHYYGGSGLEDGIKIIANDNGWTVIGTTASYGNYSSDIIIVNYDSTGNMTRQNVVGDGFDDKVKNAIKDSNGNFYIAGKNGAHSYYENYDGMLMKVSSNGSLMWIKSYGVPNRDEHFNSIIACDDGNLLMAGQRQDSVLSKYGFYIVKTDTSGNILWSKDFIGSITSEAFCIANDGMGGYLVGGYIQQNDSSGYLLHLNNAGNIITEKKIKLGFGNYGSLYSVVKTMSGDYCFTGSGSEGSFGSLYILKTDINGNIIFYTHLAGGPNPDITYGLAEMPDSGFIAVGGNVSYSNTPLLVRYDKFGNKLWSKQSFNRVSGRHDYSSFGISIVVNSDLSFTYCGDFGFFPFEDGMIVHADQEGNVTPCISVSISTLKSNFCDSLSVNTLLHAPPGFSEIEWLHFKSNSFHLVNAHNKDTLRITEAGIYICIVSNGDVRLISQMLEISVSTVDTIPTINQGTVINVCDPISGTTISTTNKVGLNYEWKKNGVIIPNSNVNLITNCTTGVYTVRTFNECGSFTSASSIINNHSGPSHINLIEPLNGICSNNWTNVNIQLSPGFDNSQSTLYSIYRNDTLLSRSYMNLSLDEHFPGNYYLVTSNACGIDTSNVVSIASNARPVKPHLIFDFANQLRVHHTISSLAYTGSYYISQNINLNDATSFAWFNDNGLIPGANSNYCLANAPGHYFLISSNQCGAINSDTILVNALPFIDSIKIINSTNCSNLLLSAPNTSNSPYQWYKNGVILIGQTGSNLYATDSGYYHCSFHINPSIEVFVSDTFHIATPLEGNQMMTVSGPFVCQGDSVQLYLKFPRLTYQWYKDNLIIPGATTRYYNAFITGVYTCQTSNGGCVDLYLSKTVTVGSPLVYASNKYICSSGSIDLTSYSSGTNYQWYKDSIIIPGAISTSLYNISDPGVYYLSMVTICGSVVSDTIEIFNSTSFSGLDPTISTSLCQGDSIVITLPSNDRTYVWSSNGGIVSDSSTFIVRWPTTSFQSSLTLQVTIRSVSEGCYNISHTNFVFSENGLKEIYSVQPLSSCGFSQRELIARQDSGFIRQWFLNGDSIPGATMYSYNTVIPGIYSAITENNLGCFFNSNELEIKNNSLFGSISNSPSLNICDGESTVLSLDQNFTGIQWYRNGSLLIGETNDSITVTTEGIYSVKFGNSLGCTGSASITVQLPTLPPFKISTSSNVLCVGDSAILNYVYNGFYPGQSYQWLRDGQILNGEISPRCIVDSSGVYSLQITVDNCLFLSNQINIISSPSPYSNITSSGTSFCIGDSLELTANAGNGNTYQWFMNGLALNDAKQSYYFASQSGTYNCEVTSSCGSLLSNGIFVSSSQSVTSTISLLGLDTICIGSSAQLTVVSNGSLFQWYKDGNIISSANSLLYNATESGLYTCESINACSSLSSNAISLIVNDLPSGIILQNFHNVICNNQPIDLQLSFNNTDNFQWYKNGSILLGQISSMLTTADSGSYYCQMQNTCGYSISDTVHLSAADQITSSPGFINGNDTICPGTSQNIYFVSSIPNAQWYNWNSSSGVIISSGQGTTIADIYFDPIFSSGDVYVQAGNGCGIGQNSQLSISGDTSCIVDGITELNGIENNFSVIVSPNPSVGLFQVYIFSKDNSVKCDVQLTDIQGRVLYTINEIEPGNLLEFNLNLHSGVYFLIVHQANNFKVRKIIREN